MIGRNNLIESKKLHILYIVQPISEYEFGGADMHVLELCSNIKLKTLIEPIVLLRKNERLKERFIEKGVNCFCGSHKKNIFGYIRWANSVLVKYPFKIIHSHGYDANYHMVLLKMLYPRKWKYINSVITCHGWIETTIYLKVKTWLDFVCYNFASALIVCSSSNLSRLEHLDKNIIKTYIPNGIAFSDDNTQNHELFMIVNNILKEDKKKNCLYR